MHRARLIGIPKWRVLVWELPRVLSWRAYVRLSTLVYDLADRRRWADRNLGKRLQQLPTGDGPCFYVIAVPGVLHFLLPAVRLVRDHCSLAFIANGIAPLEARVLQREFPDIPMVRVRTLPKCSWPHGHLLSLLLRNSERDFGILDHDFYLTDPAILTQLRFRGQEFAVCVSGRKNRPTGLVFPDTHLLYLRVAPLQAIMRRYRVGAQLYKEIPPQVQPVLHSMGLSANNPPKDYQSFFDSFLLLSALAMHEGYVVRTLNPPAASWLHIGGTSIGMQATKVATHHYASARFLGLIADDALLTYYRRKHIATPETAEQLRRSAQPDTAVRIDTLIAKLKAA